MEKKMVKKFMKAMQNLGRGQKGITGLETAIILIAFVTVASVLGYSVLSAGIFSAEKGKQAVYQGLSQAQASMQVKGSVYATTVAGVVTTVDFTLASVLNDESIDLTDTTGGENTLVINYTDSNGISDTDLDWAATFVGNENGDDMLDPNEQAQITVTLPTNTIPVYGSFTLQIIPAKGASITLQRSLPTLPTAATIDLN
jgi:archaeal flagellin FlaB